MGRKYFIIAIFVLLLLIIPTQAAGSIPQFAETGGYRVTTTADTAVGACDSHCTLREAIIAANTSTGLNPIIYVPSGTYILQLAGAGEDNAATGDLDIKRPMNIIGEGRDSTIIDANNLDRAFDVFGTSLTTINESTTSEVWNDAQFLLSDVTIQNGFIDSGANGGGIRIASTAPSVPRIALVNVTVSNNAANSGGGIATQDVHFWSSGLRLLNNLAAYRGGGIFHSATVNTENRIFDEHIVVNGNFAQFGGGIYYEGTGAATTDYYAVDGAIVNNEATSDGGGIYTFEAWDVLFIGTISGNNAYRHGGGILNHTYVMNIYGSTITNNTADFDDNGSGDGGGIYFDSIAGTPFFEYMGLIFYGNHDGGNQAPNCGSSGSITVYALESVLQSLAPCTLNSTVSNVFTNPLLQPLTDNGGDTLTHALQASSPAIGMIESCVTTEDQRGVSRITYPACEPGAYAYADGVPFANIAPVPKVLGFDGFMETVYMPGENVITARHLPLKIFTEESLFNVANSTSNPAEMDNPANYRLLLPGANDSYQTSTCAAVLGDDVSVPVQVAQYNAIDTYTNYIVLIPAVDKLFIANDYRLIVCDEITDLDGNALDGNMDGTPGGDAYFDLDFNYGISGNDFVVTTPDDVTDGVCNSHCSLRDAIRAANASSDSTITLPAGTYDLSLTGANEEAALTGDLDILVTVKLIGAGADTTVINGQGSDRIFEIWNDGAMWIENITLQNGNATIGGAIRNRGYFLEAYSVHFENNTAGTGGAIDTVSSLQVNNSEFSGNQATSGEGGAIRIGTETTLLVDYSTFTANNAFGGGSAIAAHGWDTTLTNSTFSGNIGTKGVIFHSNQVFLINSTVANNGSGVLYGGIGALFRSYSTIFVNNVGVNCGVHPSYSVNPIFPIFGRFNIVDDSSCAFGARNLYNTDALLKPLSYNNGSTQTHALQTNSPARNVLRYPECDTSFDQHGNPRNVDGLCDIGAYEGVGAILNPPTNLTVTDLSYDFIMLAWTDTTGETGYHIERSSNGGTSWVEVGTTAANVTTFTNSSLTCGTEYDYRVYATDGTMDSEYSNIAIDSTLDCVTLTAPTNLIVVESGADYVILEWNDTNISETGYRFEHSMDGTNWQISYITDPDATGMIDYPYGCGITVYYRVAAVNSELGLTSTYSNTRSYALPACVNPTVFTVNSTSDAVDSNPGNNSCATSSGVCTLRAAVMESNARAGLQVIRIPAGTYNLSLTGTPENAAVRGDLDITDDVVIMGATAATTIIDGNSIDRVFDVYAPTVMQYITIREGQTESGGAGGGIRNYATGLTPLWTQQDGLYLDNLIITNNIASGNGGGIANFGYFMLLGSTVQNNTAANGGGIYQEFFNDEEGFGWSVLYSSTIDNNTATERGGGLYINESEPISFFSQLNLWMLTISNNSAKNGGGVAIYSNENLVLDTVTISGNSATENGGGILSTLTMNLERSTVTNNVADSDNNSTGSGGGLAFAFNNTFSYGRVNHTILSGNRLGNNNANNCYDSGTGTAGRSFDAGYNLLGSLGNCTYQVWGEGVNPPENNIFTDNPMLAALADNGGLTKTHALQAGSWAINAGNVSPYFCQLVPSTAFTWDQRGVERVGACDIGAYEYSSPAAADVTTLFATIDYETPAVDGFVLTSLDNEPLNGMTVLSRRLLRQDVYSPATTSITHTNGMRLVRAGANGIIDTPLTNCTGLSGDDVLVTDFFAGGLGFVQAARTPVNLPNGTYRLFICGTVLDAEGNQIDGDGNGVAGGNFVYNFKVAVGQTQLQTPSNLAVTGTTGSTVSLQWTDTNTTETGYRIQRSTNQLTWTIPVSIAANATTFTDTSLTCGTVYHYRLYAINTTSTVISDYVSTAAKPPCPVPAAPTSLQVAGTTLNSISLQWTDNASNETGFVVQRSSNGGATWAQIGTSSANVTTYSDTGLWCAESYTYRVAAVISNYGTQSAYSNALAAATLACPPAPNAPSAMQVTGTTLLSISLQWTDNASDETAIILQRSSNGTIWADYATLPANTVTYEDTVACSETFHYRVYAVNLPYAPASAASASVSGSSQPCPLPPLAFVAVATGDAITLSWADVSTNETAYLLERSVNGGASWNVIILAADATGYAETELACNSEFRYRVRTTVSEIVYSAYTTIAVVMTTCAPPIAPTNLTITDIQRRSFTVTWADNSNVEGNYLFESSADGITWNSAITLAPNSTTYTLSNLTCNVQRYMRVRAVRTPQNLYSDYTNVVNATTLACPALTTPAAPTLTAITPVQITIGWLADATGEASQIYLERRPPAGTWQALTSVQANVTAWTDSNLLCETAYEYRIRYYRAEDATFSADSDPLVTGTDVCPPDALHTVGLYKNGVWQFTSVNATGIPDVMFRFGPMEAGWTPLVGDWDGNGEDGIGIYRNGLFVLRNISSGGATDATFYFGAREAGWQPIVGDWNGDGIDTVGVYKAGLMQLTNNHATLRTDYSFRLGDGTAGWIALAGDWDDNGIDSVGLYRGGMFYLTNMLDGTGLRRPFNFGPIATDWLPLIGDWNAEGTDTIGVYRQSVWRLRNTNNTGGADVGFNFGAREAGWTPLASYRGGAVTLAALASAANVAIVPASDVPAIPPVLEITPEVTAEITPVPVTVEPTLEPSPEVTVEPTSEPTAIIELTIEPTAEVPAPVEVTAEAQPEATETVSP